MLKLIALLLLVLTLPTLQQDEGTFTETSSNPKDLQIGQTSEQIINDPELMRTKPTSAQKTQSLTRVNWDFLKGANSLIQGSPNWLVATTDQRLWLPKKSFYFKSCFCSFCPQNGITLYLSNTCYIYIKVNNNWILQVYSPNWGGYHTINIPASMLKCGCNNDIEFYGFSFFDSSPIAISYGFYQNCSKAMNCPNLGVTYYNLNTCKCQCAAPCDCRWPMIYSYTQCGCMCSSIQFCQKGQYFNRSTCNCECVPRCCKKGHHQNKITCQCEPFWSGLSEAVPIPSRGIIPIN